MNDYQNQLYDIHEEYERLRETKRVEARRIAEDTTQVLENTDPVSFAALPNIAKMGNRPSISIKKKKKKEHVLNDKNNNHESVEPVRTNNANNSSSSINTKLWQLNAEQINDTTERLNLIVQIAGTSQQDNSRTFCRNSTYGDAASLYRQNWLTGTIINHILSILLQNYGSHNIVLLPDYFYAQLSQTHRGYNFINVSDYIRRKFIEDPTHMNSDILFPIHIPGHWILAILLGREKELILIDSMHKSHPNIANNIIRWYHDMMSFLDIPSQLPMDNWHILSGNRNSPLQTDTHSCGVFVIMTAMYWIKERRLPTTSDWTQAHMPLLRSYLAFLVTANCEQPEYQNYFQDPNNSFIDLTHDENESCNTYIIE